MIEIRGENPPLSKRPSRLRLIGILALALAVLAVGAAVYVVNRRGTITPPPAAEVFLRSPDTNASTPTALPEISRLGAGPAFAVLGDSYAAAAGASDMTKGWVVQFARAMCWNLMENAAQPGTGYTTGGRPGTAPFANRVASVIDAKPSIVFVEGGGNDYLATPDDLYAAATDVFAQIRNGLGDQVQIVAIGPTWTPNKNPEELVRTSGAIAAAAADSGVTFIDPFAEFWTVDPAYFVADGYHLNDSGYAQFTNRLIDDVRRLTSSQQGVGCSGSG